MSIEKIVGQDPILLDCTLRDGSYEIDFQFSELHTSKICSTLEKSGFSLIEVGHGVGLGASEKGYGVAAATDEQYMMAAQRTLTHAYWGMFCIPNIASISDIDRAADYGMSFVRIGTNLDDYKASKKFIEYSKCRGLFVCSNFMKSYASSPDVFADVANRVTDFGSDIIYLVDSAGGMLTSDIENYTEKVLKINSNIKLGFHGHDNLGMSVANSLKAYELGYSIIDTSIAGIGRSAGNTPADKLIAVLLRSGFNVDFDLISILDIYEDCVKSIIDKSIDPIDTVSGYSLFHSSYLPVIKKYALKYRVDPRCLIINLCKEDKVNAPEDLVERIAIGLKNSSRSGVWKQYYKSSSINEQA